MKTKKMKEEKRVTFKDPLTCWDVSKNVKYLVIAENEDHYTIINNLGEDERFYKKFFNVEVDYSTNQLITREDLKAIHTVACYAWKSKIEDMFKSQFLDEKISVTKEQIVLLYDDANTEQKEVLNKFFKEDKIEYDGSKIYATHIKGQIHKLYQGNNTRNWFWLSLGKNRGNTPLGVVTAEIALKSVSIFKTFDTQKEFFEWALKTINYEK